MTIRINTKDFIRSVFFYSLLFQPLLIQNTSGAISIAFSYLDEIVTAMFIGVVFERYIRGFRFNKDGVGLVLYILLILGCGFASSAINGSQKLFPIFVDAFTCVKFPICLLGIMIMGFDKDFFVKRNLELKFIVNIMFVLDFINIFIVKIFQTAGFRFLFPAQKLMFKHPVDMADFLIIIMLILVYNSSKRKNLTALIQITAMIITTQRFKQMAIMAIIWILYIYIAKAKLKSKFPLVILVAVVVVLIGGDMLGAYYTDTTSARFLLTKVSIEIARTYFPLGLGFASYGSSMSEKYYSNVYVQYGLDHTWGLGLHGNTSFISDTFWPTVLGQMGVVGAVIIFCFFFFMLKKSALIYHCKYEFIVSISILSYFLITSLGASSIFGPYAPLLACIYGAMIQKNERKKIYDTSSRIFAVQ